jgi:murein DD-endopeptidase MepM/ murein hydrolase activator NlpD
MVGKQRLEGPGRWFLRSTVTALLAVLLAQSWSAGVWTVRAVVAGDPADPQHAAELELRSELVRSAASFDRVSSDLVASSAGIAVWVAPVAGQLRVTRPFQPPPTPYAAGHRGVDLGSTVGAPVLAAGTGVISWSGALAGRGVVVVTHGELRTTYEPVLPLLAAGAPVIGGQPIARLAAGHPGCPVAACLHWGLLRGDSYLDPLTLLRLAPVRLLPMDGG